MKQQRPYIIAEIGLNHNGSYSTAEKLVHAAAKAGVAAVKFQFIIPDDLLLREDPANAFFSRFELSEKKFKKLRDLAQKCRLDFGITPFSLKALECCLRLEPDFIKIASGDLTFGPLLKAVADSGNRVIVSTGGARYSEIDRVVDYLSGSGRQFAILHCVSLYPCPLEKANLNRISRLRRRYKGVEIGFSDHTVGVEGALLGILAGAEIIEKHFTLQKNDYGPDHKLSLTPMMMKRLCSLAPLVRRLRQTPAGKVDPEENLVANSARRSPVAVKTIRKGEVFNEDNVKYLRPYRGVSADLDVYGQCSDRDYSRGDVIRWGRKTRSSKKK